jgi:amidohydrolase
VAVIRGQRHDSGKAIGLRADMDALPMREENTFDHISVRQGVMHGCGHDGHTTMLLGAARYLAATRNFNGTAHLIFQPGEEGFGGAREMINDGLFERFPCDSVYAMHNWPNMPPGTLGVNAGPMMAAADRITISVHGKGGHGAHAYQAIDPVLISAHIITALQGVVSRSVKATDSTVLSICAVQAGDLAAMSVIPSHAKLVGTVRTFRPEVQDLVEQRIKDTAHGVAQAFGGTAEVNFERIYPATINTAVEAQFAGDVAADLMGEENIVRDMEPSMGAEDFSFMLQVRPGAYMRLGQGLGPNNCFLHNPLYDFNDTVLPLGAALFAGLAERAMPL